MNLPPLIQEPLVSVDCTPDHEYPIRILRAHRANCNCRWKTSGLSAEQTRFYELMNHVCELRAQILDDAIRKLELAPAGPLI